MHVIRERILLLRALRPARAGLLTALVAVQIVQNLLPAATALAMAALTGGALRSSAGTDVGWVGPLALFGGALLLGHLLDALLGPFTYLARNRIDGHHRAEVAQLASTRLTLRELEDPAVQDLVRLATADPENWTEKTPGDGALAQLSLLTRYFGAYSACAVLTVHAWWAVPAVGLPALAVRAVKRRQFLAVNRLWAAKVGEGRLAGYWKDLAVSAAEGKELRIFGFGDWIVARSQHHLHAMFDQVWSLGLRVQARQVWVFLLSALPLAAVFAGTANEVAHGRQTVAVETAVLTAAWAVFSLIGFVTEAFAIEGAIPVVKARMSLEALPSAPDAPQAARPTALPSVNTAPTSPTDPPVIRMSGICFSYPGTTAKVLDGLDLEVGGGEMLAIVGLNGAGKSTLIKLLTGLYEPTAGRIFVDGTDLNEYGAARWRQSVAAVFQDFIRYHLSARANITLGNPAAPYTWQACDASVAEAGLDAFLADLPAGLETPLARDRTGGIDLSGGQWQQLALARALYAVHTGARTLILDEPTAHLDVRSEFELFDRLTGRGGDTTVVLISHRLSTVRQADRIVVLDGGRITESGSHDELMALGGSYAEMFTIQAERFARGYDDRIDEGELV